MKPKRWIVSQIGSREHYAASRSLHQQNALDLFLTDAWCRWGGSLLRRGPRRLRGLAGRRHADLPSAKVVSFTVRTLLDEMFRSGSAGATIESQFREHLRIGRDFALRVNGALTRQKLDAATQAFFGYDTGCLETLELLRGRGVTAIVDQIDPGRVEEQMVFEEAQRWPDWQASPGRIPDDYYERLSREWELASRVLVNSAWSRSALIQQGVPEKKVIVVPLAYEPEAVVPREPRSTGEKRPLVVLWLGSVILRKGIQYLIQAAKLLEGTPVRFVIAGPVGISEKAVATAPRNMEFIGRITRDRAGEVFRAADLFVLPTISDGFAITQLEAMAHGLPVIATPNCGEVVTHGRDGLIVPARDAEALAAAIARLDAHRDIVAEMSRQAVEKSRAFSLERFAKSVMAAGDAVPI